ncbi:transposase [Aerococcaceae bacterium DSM 111020]|nr:transposase [Aerococcaceae bacterium DSM 111020]
MNNKIKMIKRSGYGYRNFGHLRCRILISYQFKEPQEETLRHLYFSEEEADLKYNKQKSA